MSKHRYVVGWVSLEERWYGAFHANAESPADAVELLAETYFDEHRSANPDSLAILFVRETRARNNYEAFVEFLQHTPMYPFWGTTVYPNPAA